MGHRKCVFEGEKGEWKGELSQERERCAWAVGIVGRSHGRPSAGTIWDSLRRWSWRVSGRQIEKGRSAEPKLVNVIICIKNGMVKSRRQLSLTLVLLFTIILSFGLRVLSDVDLVIIAPFYQTPIIINENLRSRNDPPFYSPKEL